MYTTKWLTEKYGDFEKKVLVEERDGFTTIWHVDPPAFGSAFMATRDEWNDDGTVRNIYEWVPA